MDLVFTGDVILDEPDPDHWLSGIAPALQRADLAIGHLEVPHTLHTQQSVDDVPAPGAHPDHVAALARAGFDAMTLAGNHIADLGGAGIADTIAALQRAGLAFTGAGMDLAQASRPAYLRHGDRTIALLSYNCVGPVDSWASEHRAGCSYLHVRTADGSPPRPAADLVQLEDEARAMLTSQIQGARANAELVVVALHKGIVHTRARLASYERDVAHAAIDAGAAIVVSHHAHIVRGIEIYRGAPIFHGLGNGCVVTRALAPDQSDPRRAAWARRRRELFGFEPDPEYVLAPFHPEAVNAMLGRVVVTGDAVRVGFLPVYVEAPGRPRIAFDRMDAIARYVSDITVEAGLPRLDFELSPEGIWLN